MVLCYRSASNPTHKVRDNGACNEGHSESEKVQVGLTYAYDEALTDGLNMKSRKEGGIKSNP